MYKPPRRTHTSTGRFPFSRRSPSKHRAFLGVFNITKSFGRYDKCQRPRISLQIKRCQPITPPIIRRKHREIPIFTRGRYAGAFDCRILAKMHVAITPTWREPKQKRGLKGRAPSLIQIYIARNGSAEGNLPFRRAPQDERTSAARSAQRRFFHVRGRAGKVGCPRAEQLWQLTPRYRPSRACPQQHQTGYQSGSRGASSSQGRSRCNQPGRSRSRRRRKPCCRSRPPGR